MKNILSRLITKLVYPDGLCCVICEKELTDGSQLCGDCRPQRIGNYCRRCGNVLYDPLPHYCDKCLTVDRSILFDEARAPFEYKDERVRKIVQKIKYGKAPYLAAIMAAPMLEVLREQPWTIDLVTYVPLHPRKERKRTYNQAQLMAERIAEGIERPLVTTLIKTAYERKSATKMGREDRIRLLSGSFILSGADIKGKSILLVDDVLTSKATANECTKMLKFGKAKRVYVLTYATSRGDAPMTYDGNRKTKFSDI